MLVVNHKNQRAVKSAAGIQFSAALLISDYSKSSRRYMLIEKFFSNDLVLRIDNRKAVM